MSKRREPDDFRWRELFHRPLLDTDVVRLSGANAGKTILLTGAGGSIGSALAKAILASGPRLLILLDHSDHNLHGIQNVLAAASNRAPFISFLGDVCDAPLLAEVLEEYRPDTIFHAAAFKHVPLMEINPFAAVRNNSMGTYRLATAAMEHQTPRMIMISTDKAVNPHSVMGASKRIAELILLALNNRGTRMSAVRMGNVVGTQGSVVPLFLGQIARGGPVTVTHPRVRRYLVTLLESVEVILKVASLENEDGIFVPEMGSPIKIVDLANYLIRNAGSAPSQEISVAFTGLRPGDKMTEDLISERESLGPGTDGSIHRVSGLGIPRDTLEAAMRELAGAVCRRDLAALLDTIRRMVPKYQPSRAVLEQLSISLAGARKA